jgi:hypothetical protein
LRLGTPSWAAVGPPLQLRGVAGPGALQDRPFGKGRQQQLAAASADYRHQQ